MKRFNDFWCTSNCFDARNHTDTMLTRFVVDLKCSAKGQKLHCKYQSVYTAWRTHSRSYTLIHREMDIGERDRETERERARQQWLVSCRAHRRCDMDNQDTRTHTQIFTHSHNTWLIHFIAFKLHAAWMLLSRTYELESVWWEVVLVASNMYWRKRRQCWRSVTCCVKNWRELHTLLGCMIFRNDVIFGA